MHPATCNNFKRKSCGAANVSKVCGTELHKIIHEHLQKPTDETIIALEEAVNIFTNKFGVEEMEEPGYSHFTIYFSNSV